VVIPDIIERLAPPRATAFVAGEMNIVGARKSSRAAAAPELQVRKETMVGDVGFEPTTR
jgi:hypothetical protein